MGTSPDLRVETYGWDLVHAVTLSCINDALSGKPACNPVGFAQRDPTAAPSDPAADYIEGSFGRWTFTTGGSEGQVFVTVPVTSVIGQSFTQAFSVSDMSVTVGVLLKHLSEDMDPEGRGRKPLAVEADPDDGSPAVTVESFDFGTGPDPGTLAKATLMGLLTQWLNANIGTFSAMLHFVKLDRTAADPANQWLQPADCGYAYCDLPARKDGVLGLLSMSEKDGAAGLVRQVSENILGSTCNAAYVIGAHQIMRRWILPRVSNLFPGSTPADFALSPDGQKLGLARSGVGFTIIDSKGDKKQAWIEDLQSDFEADAILISATTSVRIPLGLLQHILGTATILYCEAEYSLALNAAPIAQANGDAPTLSFSVTTTKHSYRTDEPDSDAIAEADWQVVLAAINLVGLLDGGILVPAPLEISILLASQINSLVVLLEQPKLKDEGALFGKVAADISAPFDLPVASEFALQEVALNGSLVIRGAASLAY